jgi:hypothetical protein
VSVRGGDESITNSSIEDEVETMSITIESRKDWQCPDCDAALDAEEVEDVIKLLNRDYGQVELRCPECDEPLTADATDCESGQVCINQSWVYE